MITQNQIIQLIKKTDISQKAINAIHAIIVLEEQEDEDEIEHSVLTNEKKFQPYESSTFVTERFY